MRSSLTIDNVKQIIKFLTKEEKENDLLCEKAIGKLANSFLDDTIRREIIPLKIIPILYDIFAFIVTLLAQRNDNHIITAQLYRALSNLSKDEDFIQKIILEKPGKYLRMTAEKCSDTNCLKNCLRLIKKLLSKPIYVKKLVVTEDITTTLVKFYYAIKTTNELSLMGINKEKRNELFEHIMELLLIIINSYSNIIDKDLSKAFKDKNQANDHFLSSKACYINPLLDEKFLESLLSLYVSQNSSDCFIKKKSLDSQSNNNKDNLLLHNNSTSVLFKLFIEMLHVSEINHALGNIGAVKVFLILLQQNLAKINMKSIPNKFDFHTGEHAQNTLFNLLRVVHLFSTEVANKFRIRDFGGLPLLLSLAWKLVPKMFTNEGYFCHIYLIILIFINFIYENSSMVILCENGLLNVINSIFRHFLSDSDPDFEDQNLITGEEIVDKDFTSVPPLHKNLSYCEKVVVLDNNEKESGLINLPFTILHPLSNELDLNNILKSEYDAHLSNLFSLDLSTDHTKIVKKMSPSQNNSFCSYTSPTHSSPGYVSMSSPNSSNQNYYYSSTFSPTYSYSRSPPFSPSSVYSNYSAEFNDPILNYYSSEEEFYIDQMSSKSLVNSTLQPSSTLLSESEDIINNNILAINTSQLKSESINNTNVSLESGGYELISPDQKEISSLSFKNNDNICFCSSGLKPITMPYHKLMDMIYNLLSQVFRMYHFNPTAIINQNSDIFCTMLDLLLNCEVPHRRLIRTLSRVCKNERYVEVLLGRRFPFLLYKLQILFQSLQHKKKNDETPITNSLKRESDQDFEIFNKKNKRPRLAIDLSKNSLITNTTIEGLKIKCSSCHLKASFIRKLMKSLQHTFQTSHGMLHVQQVMTRIPDSSIGDYKSSSYFNTILSFPFLIKSKNFRKICLDKGYLKVLESIIEHECRDDNNAMKIFMRYFSENILLSIQNIYGISKTNTKKSHHYQFPIKLVKQILQVLSNKNTTQLEKLESDNSLELETIKLYTSNHSERCQDQDALLPYNAPYDSIMIDYTSISQISPVLNVMLSKESGFKERNREAVLIGEANPEELQLLFKYVEYFDKNTLDGFENNCNHSTNDSMENILEAFKEFYSSDDPGDILPIIDVHLGIYKLSHRFMMKTIEKYIRSLVLPSLFLSYMQHDFDFIPLHGKNNNHSYTFKFNQLVVDNEFGIVTHTTPSHLFKLLYIFYTTNHFSEASRDLVEFFIHSCLPLLLTHHSFRAEQKNRIEGDLNFFEFFFEESSTMKEEDESILYRKFINDIFDIYRSIIELSA